METRRWINQSQPQTLQIAVFLLYIRSAFALLFGLDASTQALANSSHTMFLFLRAFVIAGGVAGAYLIANEKKWGYYLGIAVAGVALLGRLYVGIRYHISPLDYDIIGFAFDVALVALLVHTQTREYTRIWFK
jgi:hypothetical protein